MYACGGSIMGMNVKVFNCENPSDDTNGQFFTLLNTYPTSIKVDLKKRNNFSPSEYRSMFGIINFLEHKGYDIMFSRTIKWTNDGVPTVQKVRLSKDFRPQISSAATAVSITDILT
jgi:alpha-L-fucosidase